MRLFSPAFRDNQAIPSKYTCDGENLNPPLGILEPPEKTKSLALIMDDPDSPSGTFLHWMAWNIDPQIRDVSEGAKLSGVVEGINDFGKAGYGGPCPHYGKHRYKFNLYALDIMLGLSRSAKRKDLEEAMRDHILKQIELTGFYKRERPSN